MYVRYETPDPITARLVQAMSSIQSTPAATEFIRKFGSDPLTLSPVQLREFQVRETERFRRIASEVGIQPQ
ncbi:hypothetical protein ASE11_10525 [Hydrogenophaga sp. Root209]|nr:hypothetical protein ASE11_10525 [Hydrogenophaga sp. Root209]